MYTLAAKSTPEKARKEAMRLAEKGTTITHEIAKNLVKKHKDKELNGKAVEVVVSVSESARATEPENGKQTRSQTVAAPAADSEETVDMGFPISETEPETETPRNGSPKEGDSKKPPKQYPRSHWFKQWQQSIGPLVRLVDKISKEVGEPSSQYKHKVHELLNDATEEMTTWMKVEA
jgi:hypothetical protein